MGSRADCETISYGPTVYSYMLRGPADFSTYSDGLRVRFPAGANFFLFSTASKPALRPTQHPIQWTFGALSPGGKSGKGVKLTTHLHLVPRSRKVEIYLHSSDTSSWYGAQLSIESTLPFYPRGTSFAKGMAKPFSQL
jgi:hypothetical protein